MHEEDQPPSGKLRPGHVQPSGERLRTLWLMGIAWAESQSQPRAVPELRQRPHSELAQIIIEAFADEDIERAKKREYQQGHPKLSDPELDMMVEAEKKAGHPMPNLRHAKKVLGRPSPAQAARQALARAMQVIAGKDLMDDPELMARGIDLESRVWEPAEKDFDDAAMVIQAFRRELKALEAIRLVLSEVPAGYVGYRQSPPLAPL